MYESSFPAAERKPFAEIIRRSEADEYLCFVTQAENSIVAFALLLPLPETNLTFLEYIAVDEAHQSKGLGGELLRFIIKQIGTPLICEVEPPESENPNDEKKRRIQFYERLGGRVIQLSTCYRMPNFEAGSGGVSLLLMQTPLTEQPDEQRTTDLIQGIYVAAYPACKELRDEVLANLLSPKSGRGPTN
ncbi:MAG: GNAT family N-acetyltransferase [Proteobacteria bacterium]|nr:MAG: GNAT family N-acetyltransferase [Pseudomonadota bacterium]